MWTPIQDLPENWRELESRDFSSLLVIWIKEKTKLVSPEDLKTFEDKLKREWSIETGVIENLYTLDRGVTRVLIENGVHANLIQRGDTNKPPELVVELIADQEQALEAIFDFVKDERPLSTSYIKALHSLFTRHQATIDAVDSFGNITDIPLLHGDWKKWPNNPTHPGDHGLHFYAPPEHVASEMDSLIAKHREHIAFKVSPEIEAAWLHHRFTQIHPFQDGNGRLARALASMVFIRAGGFPLVINRDNRADYIKCLERADAGSLQPLVQLFVDQQKRAIINGLGIVREALSSEEPGLTVLRLCANLEAELRNEFDRYADKMRPFLSAFSVGGYVTVFTQRTGTNDSASPSELGDPQMYRSWTRLLISVPGEDVEVTISFFSIGAIFNGAMTAVAYEAQKGNTQYIKNTYGLPLHIPMDTFEFSYKEEQSELLSRFKKWLNLAVGSRIDQWLIMP